MTNRNPKLDPQPGDIWRKDGRYFMVHGEWQGNILGSTVNPGQETVPMGGVRILKKHFRAKLEGAEYLDLSAEQWAAMGDEYDRITTPFEEDRGSGSHD